MPSGSFPEKVFYRCPRFRPEPPLNTPNELAGLEEGGLGICVQSVASTTQTIISAMEMDVYVYQWMVGWLVGWMD